MPVNPRIAAIERLIAVSGDQIAWLESCLAATPCWRIFRHAELWREWHYEHGRWTAFHSMLEVESRISCRP